MLVMGSESAEVSRGGTAAHAGDELDAPEHGLAVIAQQQACSILHLELGPLDGPGPLAQIVALLNQLLDILG